MNLPYPTNRSHPTLPNRNKISSLFFPSFDPNSNLSNSQSHLTNLSTRDSPIETKTPKSSNRPINSQIPAAKPSSNLPNGNLKHKQKPSPQQRI
ncbi:hypothetical protein COLO4_06827 [Corchorus olitorius]|uniref:Uncharacterized protein n=1 Tax=Corchorus olitorius TaxID=93759 RepID=A0A1R3KLT4_9ROSI|nr:hypothetical protein COLO4_06827 [Corchorus olitorius]